jgi:hypothetical protein
MARDRKVRDTHEDDDELVTVTMTDHQYSADYGRLEPGDEVDMSMTKARRWVGLHLAEADGITYEDAKTPGRVRKINPYVEPEASVSNMNPQMAAMQQQIADLTRLVESQLGGARVAHHHDDETPAQGRAARRTAPLNKDKGAVGVPDPIEPTPPPSMTTEAKTFSEAAADAKKAEEHK